jgi:UPF0716 protein FxsA
VGGFLLAGFIVVPIIEVFVIAAVADWIGLGMTLLLLFGFSIAGAILAKREGLLAWSRLRATLKRGEMPSAEVVDGFLVLLGGALLLTPGFVTDAVGLLLVFPGSRAVVKSIVRPYIARRIQERRMPISGRPIRVRSVQVKEANTSNGRGS